MTVLGPIIKWRFSLSTSINSFTWLKISSLEQKGITAAYALFKKFDSGTVDKTRKLFNL